MERNQMAEHIKQVLCLETEDYDQLIDDTIWMVCDYCNLSQAVIPDVLEPIIRRKVQQILDFENANGKGYHPEVASIKEGDGTITWAQTEGNTRASIYGLSESDKAALRRHRRLRGYV